MNRGTHTTLPAAASSGPRHYEPGTPPANLRASDGLYQVTTRYLCAGFVVAGGKVVACAPILRKRLAYWRTIAERVGA